MVKTREQRYKEYNALLQIKKEAEKKLLLIPGVVAVSVGLKVTNALVLDETVLRVYVDKKKPTHEIPVSEIIPPTINNIITDVNEITNDVKAGAGRSDGDNGEYRPLCGGVKIRSAGPNRGLSGTLGCIVVDNGEDGEIYLLTNYHILRSMNEKKGHEVGQPDFCCDGCLCTCGEIAKLERWGDIDNDNVDCAIAILLNEHEYNWTNEIPGLGSVWCIPLDPDTGDPVHPETGLRTNPDGTVYKPVLPNDTVFKRGMSSGLTEGIVIDPTAPATVNYSFNHQSMEKHFTNQILIHPKPGMEPFVKHGDSGAVVLNHLNEVIGLHFAENEERDENNNITSLATKSYANPIQDVLKVLNVNIPSPFLYSDGFVPFPKTLPIRSANDPAFPSKKDLLAELEKTIESYTDGSILINAFKKHRSEVMQLINNDREVKVVWNRYKGPSFVAHLMEKLKDRQYKFPPEIESISYQRLLTKMSVILEKKGSPQMAADIGTYSTKIFVLIGSLINSFNG